MEILSTGQKIKRARIYKGITLKELCKDKISISKMSCIENGKVKADSETIKYISEIIGVDFDYLMQDIYEQIVSNLESIKKDKYTEKELEDNIGINLSYAIEYDYNNLALELVHILFKYYLDNKKYDKCEGLISKYYAIYENYNSDEATLVYYTDLAEYLVDKEEYYEAIVYYSRLREANIVDIEKSFEEYSKVVCREAICYYMLKDYNNAYELLKKIIKIEDQECEDPEAYEYYAATCIMLGFKEIDKNIDIFCKLVGEDKNKKAMAQLEFANAYFRTKDFANAEKTLEEALENFSKDNLEERVNFINECIGILLDNGESEKAYSLIEGNLNNAISTDDIKLIERSYYLKGMALKDLNRLNEAEMYLNLSLDSLYKFGTKKERHDRYLDLGYLYYEVGELKDAIKYFNFAMDIEKEM